MTITLQSEQISVKIAETGAELQSIQHRHTGLEYLWQGQPDYWNRKAPVLFPIVGRLHDNQYTYQGKEYGLNQHGFARDSVFKLVEQTETSARFELKANAETKKHYPFDFSLIIAYTIQETAVTIAYEVKNHHQTEEMLYSIGGHPGFNIPLTSDTTFEDYALEITPNEQRAQIPLKGPFADPTNKKLRSNEAIQLTHDLFAEDALIFETKGTNVFHICSDKTTHAVKLTVEDFPYVGVWSPPGEEAPFVCIEPWHGIADTIDASGKLEEKLGIRSLAPRETFATNYTIEVQ